MIFKKDIEHPNEFSEITGKTQYSKDIKAIDQCIGCILATAKGELFGDPNFGCNLYTYIHEYEGEPLKSLVKRDIVQNLTEQETRIFLEESDISIEFEGSDVLINIKYNIRYTEYENSFTYVVSKSDEEG